MFNYFFIIYLIIVSFFLASCSFFQKATLTINVESSGMPVENSLVTLYSVAKYRSDSLKILETVTPKNGTVQLPLDLSKVEILKIVVQNHNVETLYYPVIKYLNPPKWWQDHDIVLNVNLSSWKLKKHQAMSNNDFITKETSFIPIVDFPEIPLTDTISIDQMEASLLPELPKELVSFSAKVQSNFNTTIQENKNPNTMLKSMFNNKNSLFEDALKIVVTTKGEPLEGVHVFVIKNGSQSVTYLGSSDMKGMLNVSTPINRRPDAFIFKKASYATVLKPMSVGSGKKIFQVEMQEGTTTEVLLQSYAYGVGRGFDKSRFLVNGLKLDVSGFSGFMVTHKSIDDDKMQVEVQQNFALPEKFNLKPLVKSLHLNTFNNKIPTVYVSSIIPYKPAVGFVEPILSGELQTHQSWRRLRREFFTRFMNDFSIRGIIFDDVLKMANSIALSPYEMAKSGWNHAAFASELDLLIEIKHKKTDYEDDFTLVGLIYDKSGKIVFEQNMLVKNEAESEKIAAKMYLNLISNLPIEGYVIKKDKDSSTINLGKLHSVIEGDQFVAFGQKNSYAPPDKPISILKVKSVSEKESIVIPITEEGYFQNNEVIRVIRYPEKIIQKDFQTQVAQVQ